MKVEFPNFKSTMLGYECIQCGATFIYISAAANHEEHIEDNNGICKDAPESEEENE
jgi:DNA-directed RNA polymerase subunit RPC12/RpoP